MASSSNLPNFSSQIQDINDHRSTVVISVDKSSMSALVGRLQPYKSIPRLLKPGLENVATYVRETMITETFLDEGPGWAPLSRRSQRERKQQGYPSQHPILRRTGDLMKELTEKSHPHHVEVVKVGKMARIEIGGSSKKFTENQRGVRSQRLPARPMIPGTGRIPVKEKHRNEITRILQRSIERAIK